MEHYDAQNKVQRLLNLCTADMGKESFANFTYDRNGPKGDLLQSKIQYDPSQF